MGGGAPRTEAPTHPANARFAKMFWGPFGDAPRPPLLWRFYWAKKSRAKIRVGKRAEKRALKRANFRAPKIDESKKIRAEKLFGVFRNTCEKRSAPEGD